MQNYIKIVKLFINLKDIEYIYHNLSVFCLSLDNNNREIFHLLMSKLSNSIIPYSFKKKYNNRKNKFKWHFPSTNIISFFNRISWKRSI